jgi:hypothetical protein
LYDHEAELRLRILVKVLHVGMGRRVVEVIVEFLDIFPMISFMAVQAKEPFLKYGVLAIPEDKSKTEVLVDIGDACWAILTPPVYARVRVVIGEIIPGFAFLTVVFAHGPPLALAQVGSPPFSEDLMCHVVAKSFIFGEFFTHIRFHLPFSALINTTCVLFLSVSSTKYI